VILADTSAWVEFLGGTGSAVNIAVREHLSVDILPALKDGDSH